MFKKLLFVGFCFLVSLPMVAQEKLVLRTDRDYYVGGEEVWINITNVFIGTNKISDLSEVVYLEVSNEQFKPVVQAKFKLKQGMVTSVVTLPDTISTGNYSMRAYTKWMRNGEPEDYTYKTISVVNPFSKNPMPKQSLANISKHDSLAFVSEDSNIDNGIKINTNKAAYRKRDEVTLKVSASAENGEPLKYATVSVVKSSLLYDSQYNPHQALSTYSSSNNLMASNGSVASVGQMHLIPEMKGEWVTGTITNINTGAPIVGEQMALSFLGNSPVMGLCKTDAEGRFQFEINEYGEKEMVIQPLHLDTAHIVYKVNLDASYSQDYPKGELPPLVMSKEKAEALNKAIVNMQVNTIYASYLNQVVAKDSIKPKAAFYGDPEMNIPLGKFIDLPNMEEVIRELVPSVFLRKHKGNYYLKVMENGAYLAREDKVILMVDGVPFYNLNSVLAMKPSNLNRVEVLNLDYYLGEENLGMLLCFYTNEGNMDAMDFDPRIFRQAYKCYHYAYTYHCPDYSLEEMKKSRLADFRNCLYFGSVDMNANGEAEVNISSCDDIGEYTIVVEGVDAEGNTHKSMSNFEVK